MIQPTLLDLTDIVRVIVFASRPDAHILGCGGLLALLARKKVHIHVEVLTDGEILDQENGAAERRQECQAATATIGSLDTRFWGLPTRSLRLNQTLLAKITQRIEATNPSLILLPSPWETHPDDVALAAAGIESISAIGSADSNILFYEMEIPLQANCLIEISDVESQKQGAMERFNASNANPEYAYRIRGLNAYRAYSLGIDAKAAEAFHRPAALFLQYGGVTMPTLVARAQPTDILPAVDVLVRSTGRPELLQALQSIVGQTYANLRVILLDIGGNIPFPLDSFADHLPLKILSVCHDTGRAEAANHLLSASDAPYALFLDDDDWLLPQHIENLYNGLLADPQAVAAYGDTVCLEQIGGQWEEIRRFTGPVELQRLVFENRLPIHSVLFRRGMCGHLRFDPEFDLYEDWDWWLQVAACGSFRHIPKIGAVYRIHAAGGLGVRADERRSAEALDKIIYKWHVASSPEDLKERLAYVRQVLAALETELAAATKLRMNVDELTLSLQRCQKRLTETENEHRTALQLKDRQIATSLDLIQSLQAELNKGAAEGNSKTGESVTKVQILESHLANVQGELAREQRKLASIYASKSWRVTRYPRGAARLVRRLVGAETVPEHAVPKSSFRQRLLQRMRGSQPIRWLYYRLPLTSTQRFKLRTWGRGLHAPELSADEPSLPPGASSRGAFLSLQLPLHFAAETPQRLPMMSVVIPCFNQGQFLSDSIASVYAAYSGPLDILVVNDGSTEPRTLRCLREIAMLYPEVRVIHQQNGGLSAARNAGISRAKGEFIQFLDADDQLVPGKLDVQLRHIFRDAVDVSICNYLIADANLTELAKTDETIANHSQYTLADILFKWERSLSIPIHCGLFSRRIFEQIQFNTTLHAKEDWVFWCSLAKAGFLPAYVDFHGAIYRMHEGSMRRSFVRMARQWMQAVAYLDPLVADEYPSFFEESVRWVNQYYRSNPIYQDEIARMTTEK